MIGRAATSAVRRVCSMLAPASKSPPTNLSFKRFACIVRHEDVKNPRSIPVVPSVIYRATEEFSRNLKVELSQSHNDTPIYYLSRYFIGGFHFTPISLEDDGSLSPKRPIFVPKFIRNSTILHRKQYNFNGVFVLGINDPRLFAWNPATSEIRELPVSPHKDETKFGNVVMKYSLFLATWTDPKSEDYKVISLFSYVTVPPTPTSDCDDELDDYVSSRYPIEIELYSLKTDSWKKLHWECEDPMWEYSGRCCYINGVLYMQICCKGFKNSILCFDFPSETFSRLPLPPVSCYEYELVKYNGQLSVFTIRYLGPDETCMVHWVRKNGEWVKVGEYHLQGVSKPLGFARNDGLLLFQRHYCPNFGTNLMVYDFTTKVLKLVPDCVTRGDYVVLEFNDSSSVKLKPPSGEQEKDGRMVQDLDWSPSHQLVM